MHSRSHGKNVRDRYLVARGAASYAVPGRRLLGRPDVMVRNAGRISELPTVALVAELPKARGVVLPAVDRITEPFIEIRDTQHRDLVAVIELLSPTNKAEGPDRIQLRPQVDLWPIGLRESLPRIPVPLRGEDPDAVIDLHSLLHDQYDAAGYTDYIYTGSLRAAVRDDEQDWVAERISMAAD